MRTLVSTLQLGASKGVIASHWIEYTQARTMSLFRRLFEVARSQLPSERLPPLRGDSLPADSIPDPVAGTPPKPRSTRRGEPIEDDDAKYYANLELHPGASPAEIKDAYRRLMRRYHPDRHHGNEAQRALALEITKGLNEAMNHFEKKFERERS